MSANERRWGPTTASADRGLGRRGWSAGRCRRSKAPSKTHSLDSRRRQDIRLSYPGGGLAVNAAEETIAATLDAKGQLQLSHPPQLPPGPVQVTIRVAA